MKIAIFAAVLLGVVVLLELGLRWGLGLGRPPLYQADDSIGYLLAPNQQLRRFGNRIAINAYAMRNEAIQPQRPEQTLRVLLLGDSIVNGNWWTDQTETLSALLENTLRSQLSGLSEQAYTDVEVLNVSANSWGPRNQRAYVERYGTFDAQVVVLVLNTDDLFATAPTSLQVGRDPGYPDRNPGGAIAELIDRKRNQGRPIPGLKEIQNESGDRVGTNLAAVEAIYQQVIAAEGNMILVLTPLKREVLPPGPRDYEIKARQRVDEWVADRGIAYVNFLGDFQAVDDPETLYRDHIHLSPTGNVTVKDALFSVVRDQLSTQPVPSSL
ncbi:MAG: SGNH/GDSL hydrolase family protein [Cyanobacteria bacterium J06632_22]